ncbi:hypothetical protein BASA50_003682 [Batrachochytrium salamandrivorans]|uniref:RecQ-mediated genome instability protein 1 n=1 Tax=Batrachochytrium salamandrivorans TaxID=1357716 RepID=A0ABQ8FIJ7_9FUNG|nr:hypothetical protein BASA50_003682 [Batrachochytrium salamandrivorans]
MVNSMIQRKLDSYNLGGLHPEWLAQCLQYIQAGSFHQDQTAELLLEQVLHSNMSDMMIYPSVSALPPGLDLMHNDVLAPAVSSQHASQDLPNCYFLQVVGIQEVGNASQQMLDLIVERKPKKGEPHISGELVIPRKMLRLHLSDGFQTCIGIEHTPIAQIDILSLLGMKVLISNVQVRRGVLLLNASNTRVLGGSVAEMNTKSGSERLEAQLRSILTGVSDCTTTNTNEDNIKVENPIHQGSNVMASGLIVGPGEESLQTEQTLRQSRPICSSEGTSTLTSSDQILECQILDPTFVDKASVDCNDHLSFGVCNQNQQNQTDGYLPLNQTLASLASGDCHTKPSTNINPINDGDTSVDFDDDDHAIFLNPVQRCKLSELAGLIAIGMQDKVEVLASLQSWGKLVATAEGYSLSVVLKDEYSSCTATLGQDLIELLIGMGHIQMRSLRNTPEGLKRLPNILKGFYQSLGDIHGVCSIKLVGLRDSSTPEVIHIFQESSEPVL